MRLILVRHGQTAWNAESRAQGHTDIELDERGRLQALRLGERFGGHPPIRVVSSDLSRSLATAEPPARAMGVSVEADARLRERGFGDWEGLSFHELQSRKLEIASREGIPLEAVVPPNGESILMVWERLAPVAQELVAEGRDTLVVTHGGSCALLLSHLILGDWHTARAFRFGNASVTELARRPGGGLVITSYNDMAHLGDVGALAGDLGGSHRPT